MSKKLVIAEKPSVGRDIARVLKCGKKENGYFESSDYIVTWAMGHLVELASPEYYDKKYAAWKLDDLPIIPKSMKTSVIKKTGKQFSTIKRLIGRKDVKNVIIATDAGREGELVARWILEEAGSTKPIERLWISSVTDKAIADGFKNLKPGHQYDNLYLSALARAKADWIVGINATRALTTKYNAQLSCGRVQTPTLNLIKTREEEIENFKPKEYWEVIMSTSIGNFKWVDKNNSNHRIYEKITVDKILNKTEKSEKVEIINMEIKDKSIPSPLLFDLTELQREANKRFGYSAKETLSLVQRLYENHKLLTYPRTDSKYLSKDIAATIKERLSAIDFGSYSRYVKQLKLVSDFSKNKIFNDNKVTDHHALIPTEEKSGYYDLSDSEMKIFDMVVRRFLAALMPHYTYRQFSVEAEIQGERFLLNDSVCTTKGWKSVYDYDEHEKNESMPKDLKSGDIIKVTSIKSIKDFTKPPKLFTEGTLLSAMENPTKYMSARNKELARLLDETGGLGTVATRADIIEKLFSKFYVEKKDSYLHTTEKGRQLLNLVPNELKSPDLTAKWEYKLEKIKNGLMNEKTFANETIEYSKSIINEIKNDESKYIHTNKTGDKCPECGSYMLKEKDRNGELLKCSNIDCGKRIRTRKISNARCPQCKKRMTITGIGEAQTFICSCGYREKLSSFNKRKSQEKKGVSKRDAKKYIANQDNEEINSAMADALAKLKLD
ncbi:DNA topoisomerase III [Alkalibacter mobilis]|uniref:DNA topoisomerase III n=1 Tax=Alkalibacter mobilis TaxID=2787712 RepID=UPI00189F682E|nr:DNA topoisomerase III [Alkalibacter mobilis]MBF7095734.1 DNA topoisomerase III [Alkalibacter mobilis]